MTGFPPLATGLVISFVTSVTLCGVAIALFPRMGLLDFPERYGLTRGRIPYPVGIMAVIAFLTLFPLFFTPGAQELGLMAAIGILGVLSFVDDRTPLPAWVRLLVQVGVCFIIFATGSRIYTITNPFEGIVGGEILKLDTIDWQSGIFGTLPVLSGLFTVLWLGLTMNAMNWFDGIPGQVSSLSSVGFFMLGMLALSDRVNQPQLALLSFLLLGISAGMLLFDFPPPKLLMGDSGAMFFGLMLGVLGIYQGGKVATAFLVLGFPLLDALFVAMGRIARGGSPLKGDRDHLHHRLLKKQWSERRIIGLTCAFGVLFGITALFLDTAQKGIATLLLAAVVFGFRRYAGRSA